MVAKCKFRVVSKVSRTFIVSSTFHTTNLSFLGNFIRTLRQKRVLDVMKYIDLFLSI